MKQPNYLYGDYKIRRQCAWVEDPVKLRDEVKQQGANHPLFWVRDLPLAGWHLRMSAWVPGLPDEVHVYRFDYAAKLAELREGLIDRVFIEHERAAFAMLQGGISRALHAISNTDLKAAGL